MPNFVVIGQTIAEIQRFFDFSKIATVRDLGFVMRMFRPPTKAFAGLYHCAKCGENRYSSFDNMQVLIFCKLGLKMPIHAPKLGVFGGKIGEGVIRC